MGRLVRRDVNIPAGSTFTLSPTSVRAPVAAVVSPTAAINLAGAGNPQTDTDDYPTRMAKYVPAEVVTFYLLVDKLFHKVADTKGLSVADTFVQKNLYYFAVGIFALGLVGTPLYYRQMATNNEPWKVQAVIATVAFAIWAYTVRGGIFSQADLYSEAIAGGMAGLWTFAAAFVKPNK
jgi:hypothetical protein